MDFDAGVSLYSDPGGTRKPATNGSEPPILDTAGTKCVTQSDFLNSQSPQLKRLMIAWPKLSKANQKRIEKIIEGIDCQQTGKGVIKPDPD